MLKHKPIVYLALLVALGGLLLAGVPVDRILIIGFFVFMLMMHLGGHGGHGGHDAQGGHRQGGLKGHGTNQDPIRQGHEAPPSKEDEVAGK